MRRAGNEDCFQLNETETEARYMEAKEALDEFKPHAEAYRKEPLKELAKALALRNDTTEETEFKKLTNQAQQRKMGAKLRATSKKGKKELSTNFIIGPKDLSPIPTRCCRRR